MYKVVSPEWNNFTIEDGFQTEEAAREWAIKNCDESTVWGGIWQIQHYNPSPWTMVI